MRLSRMLPTAAASLTALALAGCGGSGHANGGQHNGHHKHHGHHHKHHQKAAGSANVPKEVVGTPSLAAVAPGEPGAQTVPVALPSVTSELTSTQTTGQSGSHELSKRIASAHANAVIHLASGNYPAIHDSARRSSWVTVSGAGDATQPVIAGVRFIGAEHVRFVDVRFAGKVKVVHSTEGGLHARDIEVLNSTVDCGATATGKGRVGVSVRGAAQDVTFAGDTIENCVVGFTSAAADNYSKNISIIHCSFKNIYGDAIDLGGIDGMEIANNLISGVHRSAGHHHYHVDEIQFFGNTANVVIAYNVEENSTDQMIFIQDAIKNKYSGVRTNQDILVLGNLVYGAGALAVQDQGGVNVQFIGNTIWDTHDGALLVRRSPYSHIVPTHTLVADNIVETFGLQHVPSVVEGYNVFGKTGHAHSRTDRVTLRPGFVAPNSGQFSLTAHSAARGSAAPAATLVAMARSAGANNAALKIISAYRTSDRGASIAATAPEGFGTPDRIFPAPS
jgi:hypothetical protein